MKASLTKCIWIRHAPSYRPEGHVPAHDPDIVADEARATALASILPDNAHWLVSPLRRCQQTAAQIEKILHKMGRLAPAEKTITEDIIEQDLHDALLIVKELIIGEPIDDMFFILNSGVNNRENNLITLQQAIHSYLE